MSFSTNFDFFSYFTCHPWAVACSHCPCPWWFCSTVIKPNSWSDLIRAQYDYPHTHNARADLANSLKFKNDRSRRKTWKMLLSKNFEKWFQINRDQKMTKYSWCKDKLSRENIKFWWFLKKVKNNIIPN